MPTAILDPGYKQWLLQLKQKVQQAQLNAAISTNAILIELYWELGKEITNRESEFAYGENFINQIAADLKHEFPEIKGFQEEICMRSGNGMCSFGRMAELCSRPLHNFHGGINCY